MRIKRHWRITAVLVTILLFVTMIVTKSGKVQEDQPLFPTIYKTYFPIVNTADPFVYRNETGSSWLYAPISDMERMGASWYYNYGKFENIPPDSIPMLWCDEDCRYPKPGQPCIYFYPLAREFLTGWTDKILFENEPDRGGQCNRTPEQAVEILRNFKVIIPGGKFIGPNISHYGYRLPWLDKFLAAGGKDLGIYRYAFHLYAGVGDDIYSQVDIFCAVLEKNGIVCENIWVTEYGSCDPYIMYELTRILHEDWRIEQAAVFTNRGPWGCLRIFNDDGSLTAVGEAYIKALLRIPFDQPLPPNYSQ